MSWRRMSAVGLRLVRLVVPEVSLDCSGGLPPRVWTTGRGYSNMMDRLNNNNTKQTTSRAVPATP